MFKVVLHICDTYYCDYLTHTTSRGYLIEFKLRYFKNLKLFSIRIESKIIILVYSFAEKKGDMFFALVLKVFPW